jgi:hypothetical protein
LAATSSGAVTPRSIAPPCGGPCPTQHCNARGANCVQTQFHAIPRLWLEDSVSMKRKFLKILLMLMMAIASFGAPMNPKEIEDRLHTMNETRIEFTIPDENHKGEGVKVDNN